MISDALYKLRSFSQKVAALDTQINDGDGAYPQDYHDVFDAAVAALPDLESLLSQVSEPVAHKPMLDITDLLAADARREREASSPPNPGVDADRNLMDDLERLLEDIFEDSDVKVVAGRLEAIVSHYRNRKHSSEWRPKEGRELAWLLEKHESGMPLAYFGPYKTPLFVPSDTTYFVSDVNKACRFSRKEDAEAIRDWYMRHVKTLGQNLFIAEHEWVAASLTAEE